MGYCSDVYIIMDENKFMTYKNKLANMNFQYDSTVEELFDEIQLYPETDTILLVAKSRKWYRGFPAVDFTETYLSDLDEEEYKYVSIGEDGASEEYGDYDKIYMYPITEICIDTFDCAVDYTNFDKVKIYDNNDKYILDVLY